jgi:hypothetical protein
MPRSTQASWAAATEGHPRHARQVRSPRRPPNGHSTPVVAWDPGEFTGEHRRAAATTVVGAQGLVGRLDRSEFVPVQRRANRQGLRPGGGHARDAL